MKTLIAILTITIIASDTHTDIQPNNRAPAVVDCMTDMECATLNPELEF